MAKQANPEGDYKETDRVVVNSGDYSNQAGTIIRLGSAGEVIYYHVKMDGFSTPMTFVGNQIKKGN